MISFTSKSLIITLWLSSVANSCARGTIAVRHLGHHSDKSGGDQKTALISSVVGKSEKSHDADDIALWDMKNDGASAGKLTSGSKSSKTVEVNSGYSSEPHEYNGGKSGKGGGNLAFEQSMSLSMSMMTISPSSSGMSMTYTVKGKSGKSESVHTLSSGISVTGDGGHHVKASADTIMSGKAGKAMAYPHSSTDLSMPTFDVSMTWSGKAEKPLTDFFIKTNSNPDESMMNLAGKASKATEYETIHIETTTITYEYSGDVEMIKAKSSKSDGYAYEAESGSNKGSGSSKSSKPSSSSNSTSSAYDEPSKSPSPIATSNAFVSGVSSNYSSKSNKSAGISAGLSASGSSKSAKHPTVSPTITLGSSTNPTVSSSTLGVTANDTGFDSGERPEDMTLLTLAPTPSMDLKSDTDSATSGSHSSPTSFSDTYFPTSSPKDNRYTPSSETPTTYTYEPTSLDEPSSFKPSNETETSIAINPFALSLHTNSPSPNLDPETVRAVTMEHLVHSFRNYASGGYVVKRLNLMLLDPEGERMLLSGRDLQSFDEYELIFGGILYFQTGTNTPSMSDIDSIVKSSFTGTRLDYYVNLLQEAGMGVGAVSYDEDIVTSHDESASGQKWRTISVSLGGAVGGLALVATGMHVYYKKHQMMLKSEMCDIESGRFVIKLKDEAEIEEFPGLNICQSTVANTENDTLDDRSVPSTVQHNPDEDMPSLSSRSLDAIEQEKYDPRISPLEDPPTRYISVFTVKKDVQGKALEEIDLRSLAISYLSKMLKKFPNTFLLPYDKESTLNPITSIRNIPDGLEELEQYVGNARVDEGSGKVMFNLRVESDMPVSKMKGSKNSHASMPPPPPGPSELDPAKLGKESMQETDEAQEEIKGFEDVTI